MLSWTPNRQTDRQTDRNVYFSKLHGWRPWLATGISLHYSRLDMLSLYWDMYYWTIWWSSIVSSYCNDCRQVIINVLCTMFLMHRTCQERHLSINPLTAKLFNLNFNPLEIVSRWRDPQLQVSENYSDLTIWGSTVFKYCWLMSHFIFNIIIMWYRCTNKKMKILIYAAPAVKGWKSCIWHFKKSQKQLLNI